MTVFGTNSNPGHALDEDGNPVFNGAMQENHTIPREVFSGGNQDYQAARKYLGYINFDGENADRNVIIPGTQY